MATSDEDGEVSFIQEIAFIAPDAETTCMICNAEFLDSEDLNIHIHQVHNYSNTCQFCPTTYTDLVNYADHVIEAHLLDLKCCRFCTKCFIDAEKAVAHDKSHDGKTKRLTCSQCSFVFTGCTDIAAHEFLNHDNNIDGIFIKCMVHISALLSLNATALLQSNERTYICMKCEFSSIELAPYLQHMRKKKCRIYICDHCDALFKLKKTIIDHVTRKKCLSLKEYAIMSQRCPDCNIVIPQMQLKDHKKTCQAYKCYRCNILFGTIDDLSNHQSEAHPSELELVKCTFCPKEFARITTLNKHVERSHKPYFHEYKYQCKKCEAIFKHPQNLFAHYFSSHKDFEPYTCRLCDKKFKIRKRFTIHIKLEHQSVGFVEFDDQYNVFFTDKKSENPFIPKCVVPELISDDATTCKESKTEMETDTNKTGKEVKQKPRKSRRRVKVNLLSSSEDEDVEPLLMIKKRAERKIFNKKITKFRSSKTALKKRNRFTCKICNKYCYTYQFYNNHIRSHSKNESVECIKCLKSFPSKKELKEHIAAAHTSSRLIETLKSVIVRKQEETRGNNTIHEISNVYNTDTEEYTESDSRKRFLRTIKKCRVEKASVSAKIVPSSNNLSAKKFIENFMPDINDPKEAKTDTVTISKYESPYYRPKAIKLHKFTPEKLPEKIELKMPERFQSEEGPKVKATIRLVYEPIRPPTIGFEDDSYIKYHHFDNTDSFQDNDDYDHNKNNTIPEVAEEVMLENSEEPPKKIPAPNKIVISKLPKGYPKKIHIATLQPQAPYFKIIKVESMKDEPIIIDTSIKETKKEETKPKEPDDDVIRLPDGTRLVTANPLAHLLGDKPVDELLNPTKQKQYYKPAITNYKGKLAEALTKLDKPRSAKLDKAKLTKSETPKFTKMDKQKLPKKRKVNE